MAIKYWISYRLELNDDEEYYQYRYNKFLNYISDISSNEWAETTSFHLIESDKGIDNIANSIKRIIDQDLDLVLIHVIDKKIARYTGFVSDLTNLQYFLPYIKKI